MSRAVRRWVGAVLCLVLVLPVGAAARVRVAPDLPDVAYGYDELGRLRSVTDPDAGTAVYRYDAAGNLVGIERHQDAGDPGARDQGAGHPPSEVEPARPPVVSGFAPAVVRPGGTVTIAGERFTGDPLLDAVVLSGSTYATVESASPTELVVRVPPTATSGRVSVATPAGTAEGPQPLFVVPWEDYPEGAVASTGRLELGAAARAGLERPGDAALLAFDGRRGQVVGLATTGEGLSCSDLRFGLSGPGGAELVDPGRRGDWCGGGPEAAVALPADGTYTLLAVASGDRTGPADLRLDDVGVVGPPAEPDLPPVDSGPAAAPERVVDGAAAAPVDLATGALVVEHTDLVVEDLVPLELTRRYQANRGSVAAADQRGFGWGSGLEFAVELRLSSALQYADLALPSGTEIPFERVSEGADPQDAVFVPVGSRSPVYGSRITWNGRGWDLDLDGGTTLVFADDRSRARLRAVRDRHGNTVIVDRERDRYGRNRNVVAVYSPSGRWLRLDYDGDGRVVEARDHRGRTVTYTYRADGRLAGAVSSAGGEVGYRYDDDRRVRRVSGVDGELGVTVGYDQDGRVAWQELAGGSRFSFDYTTGEAVVEAADRDDDVVVEVVTAAEVIDPAGAVRRVEFDDGHWVSDTYGVGTGQEQAVIAQRQPGTGFITALVDPDGRRTGYRYDGAGNLVQVTTGAGGPEGITTGYAYDLSTNEVTSATDARGGQWSFGYDPAGNLVSQTAPDGAQTRYGYDRRGRLAAVTGPDGNTTRIDHELAHRVTVTDPDGATYREFYDAAGRLAAVTDPVGNTTRLGYDDLDRVVRLTDPAGGETRFAYDPAGNLVGLTDAAGNTTGYSYDGAGRVTARTDPLGATDRYEYDDPGRLVAYVDRRGVRTEYGYDGLGRLVEVAYGVGDEGEPPESVVRYRYDAADRLIEVDDSAYGTVNLDYDPLGRLVREATPQGEVTYRYDRAGRRTATVLPDGTETAYGYDSASRLESIVQGGAAATASRDGSGRVARLDLPGGVTAEYTFDSHGRVSGIEYRAGGNGIGDLAYRYDPAGRRVGASGSLARTGLPDAMDRADHDTANRLTGLGGSRLRYDPAGNLVDDGTSTYTWDARGQLVAIDGPVPARFAYDPFGRRVEKTIDGATTAYLYDGENVVRQRRPDGTTASYLTGPGLDEVYARIDARGTHTYLTDVQGSVLGLAGPDGSVGTGYRYDPYGTTAVEAGGPDPNPFGYTGRERDETGLYYYRNRYYSPTLRRFLSEDPLGFAAGDTNLYAYVFNDPVNHTDPRGLQAAAGVGACLAAEGVALGVATDAFADLADLLDPDSEVPWWSEEGRIAADQLNRRVWATIDTWITICGSTVGLPGFGGLATRGVGSYGRGFPAITSRFPGLASRFPQVATRPPVVRPIPGTTPRRPGAPVRSLCSFAGDTSVLMADGSTSPIREIRPGERVLATDPETGEQRAGEVTHTWTHDDTLVDLRLGDGTAVATTADHPFWNRTDQEWQPAAALDPGEELLAAGGERVAVAGLDPTTARPGTAHNLTVDGFHTYYVLLGDTPVLVHNAECGPAVPWITGRLPGPEEVALKNTLANIDAGTVPAGPTAVKWGTPFRNRDGNLPGGQGASSPYLEYRVAPPPGTNGAGPLRVVRNPQTGETYYTWTHYGDSGSPAFVRIR